MIIQFPAKLLKNKNKSASPHDYPIFRQIVERTKVLLRITFQISAEVLKKKVSLRMIIQFSAEVLKKKQREDIPHFRLWLLDVVASRSDARFLGLLETWCSPPAPCYGSPKLDSHLDTRFFSVPSYHLLQLLQLPSTQVYQTRVDTLTLSHALLSPENFPVSFFKRSLPIVKVSLPLDKLILAPGELLLLLSDCLISSGVGVVIGAR